MAQPCTPNLIVRRRCGNKGKFALLELCVGWSRAYLYMQIIKPLDAPLEEIGERLNSIGRLRVPWIDKSTKGISNGLWISITIKPIELSWFGQEERFPRVSHHVATKRLHFVTCLFPKTLFGIKKASFGS
mmetsp:Transcript_10167/g.18474  ORF Transcript_10167/g.18474 Transcript_10167/m.18474 type:complete len:130 (+) Transcript_10167:1344-1733(+)